MTTTTLTDEQLSPVIKQLKEDHPTLGIAKLLLQLKQLHPEWSVSEKRLKKLIPREEGLIVTGLDPTIDVNAIAPKVKAKLFTDRGKGLVAKEKIEQGEVVWQEEPWIVTADMSLHEPLLQRRMCSYCFSAFSMPDPPLSVPCARCDMAHFCNRLCLSKAQASAHHPLLCPGQNKGALKLLLHIHRHGARHLDAVSKILAKIRTEEEVGTRVWEGMARVNIEKKEMERKEWEFVGEQRRREWQTAHKLVTDALNPTQSSSNYRQVQKLSKSKKVDDKWFSYDTFLELLGLASINQEDSGGLYALHAHLNHSCEPNLMARNLPKSFVPPTELPCSPPPPNGPGVRGTNKLTMIARRTIHPGEELSLPYVNFTLGRQERRQMLRELYGFWCDCPKCQRESKSDPSS